MQPVGTRLDKQSLEFHAPPTIFSIASRVGRIQRVPTRVRERLPVAVQTTYMSVLPGGPLDLHALRLLGPGPPRCSCVQAQSRGLHREGSWTLFRYVPALTKKITTHKGKLFPTLTE